MALAAPRSYCSQDPHENARLRMSGLVVAEVLLKLCEKFKFKLLPDGLTSKNRLASAEMGSKNRSRLQDIGS